MSEAGTVERFQPTWLHGIARSLAVILFCLFAALLWQAIEIGSSNTSFQHTASQIATFEASVQRLQLANREAELKYTHLSSATLTSPGDAATVADADRARGYASFDLEAEAGRYFAAICDTGIRLAQVGGLPRRFLPMTTSLSSCPVRRVNLAPGEIDAVAVGELSPTQYVQAVTVILNHYTVVANSYVLPILFGMLGALIFVIRQMVTSPAGMGDLPIVVGHALRVFLGAIFGLIIGYVNLASTAAAGLAASPLLLSLVGGYATDAVLSILDRVALAMSYTESGKRDPPALRPAQAGQAEPAAPPRREPLHGVADRHPRSRDGAIGMAGGVTPPNMERET